METDLRQVGCKPLFGLKNAINMAIVPAMNDLWRGGTPPTGKGQRMKKTVLWAGLAALTMISVTGVASAGPISQACNNSTRQAATPSMCSCIQRVADSTLQGADQRRVATFFRDPDKAQLVRMSQKRADDAFWDRYTAFGRQAEASCQG